MNRRTLLRSAGLAVIPLAGCLTETGPAKDDDNASDESDERDRDTTTDDDDSEVDTNPPPPTYGIIVEHIDLETLEERFDVAILAKQPKLIQDAVYEAIETRYETELVASELARFLAKHEFVRTDDTYYSLNARVPQEILTTTSVDPNDINDIDENSIVGANTFRKDGAATDTILTAISKGKSTQPTFSAFIHELVEEYEYVTPARLNDDDAAIYEWTIETDDRGGPPYWIEANTVESEEVFGNHVVAFESLSEAAQEEIETASKKGRQTSTSTPAILRDDQWPIRYVRINDKIYSVGVDVS